MPDKIEISYTDYMKEMIDKMRRPGLLLVSVDSNGKPNAMTIGWGTIGIIWGKPVFTVLVRPSRYTYRLLEYANDFTVNVPSADMNDIVAFCGSASGRDHDKFLEKGLKAVPGKKVKSPIIEQCLIHYECSIIHKNDVLKDKLVDNIVYSAYPKGDFHSIYYGEILSVYADPNIKSRL
ncbi:flavin reductase family protein [Candidatus Poribacteria bacterium]|nr:flavin reductase family protein [Candidatus Poribacteria bacterium]